MAASLVLLVPVVAALHPLHTVPKRGPDAFGLDFEDIRFVRLAGFAVWGPSVSPLDQLASVRVPVFFCHGKEDELVPFSEGQALYKACCGPKEHWWVEVLRTTTSGSGTTKSTCRGFGLSWRAVCAGIDMPT